jgi:hypothetical protein
MKKVMVLLLSMAFMPGLATSSFAADPILIGNFEEGSVTHGPGDIRWDNWMVNANSSAVTVPVIAATLGTHSLKWVDADGGDWLGSDIQLPYGNAMNERLEAWLQPLAVIMVDVTAFSSEVTGGWATLNLFYNASGGWGFEDATWQNVIIDGTPHSYVFTVTDHIRAVIEASMGGWGCNLGFGMRSANSSSTTLYLDNIRICPDGPVEPHGPYGHWEEQEFNVNPLFVDAVLHWKAGADPNGDFEVNPLIADQYVFLGGVAESDPNLYYLGATGEDPGLTDPNSQYGPLVLPINSTYRWAVALALEGHEQSLVPGVSTLNDVDPNNIKGPIWSFNTLSTLPTITTQPVSIRIPLGGTANPAFTIVVSSVTQETYQWFSSTDGIRDPVDEGGTDPKIGVASGGDTAAMKISNASAGYQRYFYCRVANPATVSGGGTFDDVYSNIVTCVVERKVAEYKFENNLTDTGSNITADLHPGTGINSPVFSTDRVEGSYSLSLNGIDQYVDLGTGGYPKASLVDAGGIGGGLDAGRVMCWIKLDTAPAGVAAIVSNQNRGWPTTWSQVAIESSGANTNVQSFIWGDADNGAVFWQSWRPTWASPFNMAGDGQWHLLAVTWDMNGTMKTYVDGSLIATTGTGIANTFSAWVNSTLIGGAYSDADAGTVGSYFDGLIDNLRVYNYVVAPEVIAQEYYNVTGKPGCIFLDFTGSNLNADNTGTSYCRVDIADFAVLAQNWLADGFYP